MRCNKFIGIRVTGGKNAETIRLEGFSASKG